MSHFAQFARDPLPEQAAAPVSPPPCWPLSFTLLWVGSGSGSLRRMPPRIHGLAQILPHWGWLDFLCPHPGSPPNDTHQGAQTGESRRNVPPSSPHAHPAMPTLQPPPRFCGPLGQPALAGSLGVRAAPCLGQLSTPLCPTQVSPELRCASGV